MKNQFVKGVLVGEITDGQKSAIEKICRSLSMEIPSFDSWSKQQASVFIEKYKEKSINEGKKFLSQNQKEMIKDMLNSAYINRCFIEEIEVIPMDWISKSEQLKSEVVALYKLLENGVVGNEFEVFNMHDIEEIADKLVNNQIISEEEYQAIIYYKTEEQQQVVFYDLLEKYNITLQDNKVIIKKQISKAFIEKEIEKRQSRIVKFNEMCKERKVNKLDNLLETEASQFIERHLKDFNEWKKNRLTTGQKQYIKRLEPTITDEVLSLFTKDSASQYIEQLIKEKALENNDNKKMNNEEYREYQQQKGYGFSKIELLSMDEKRKPNDWSKLVIAIERLCNYTTGLREDVDNFKDLIDVIEFTKSLEPITVIEETLQDFILPNDFIKQLNSIGINPVTPRTIDVTQTVNTTMMKLEELLRLGYIGKDELKSLIQE